MDAKKTEKVAKKVRSANWADYQSMSLKARKKVAAIMNFDSVIGERVVSAPEKNAKAIATILTRPASVKPARKAVTVKPEFARDTLVRFSTLYYENQQRFAAAAW